jgi:hypothetical protein
MLEAVESDQCIERLLGHRHGFGGPDCKLEIDRRRDGRHRLSVMRPLDRSRVDVDSQQSTRSLVLRKVQAQLAIAAAEVQDVLASAVRQEV